MSGRKAKQKRKAAKAALKNKIQSIQEQARKISREVVVVENLSYGAVALSPITYEASGKKYIHGTNIPVWSTKIGSTESHNDEYVMRGDLFNDEQMHYLLDRQPIVVVVDASTSVGDPSRTSPHIPDGFKGYRNHFMALNAILDQPLNPRSFAVDEKFVEELQHGRGGLKVYQNGR